MMAEATDQLAELLDDLALVARIESRRYDPALQETDTLELAGAAAERAGAEWASAAGDGGRVEVDRDAMIRALANLALCARRHGGVERVELTASRNFVAIEPVPDAAAPIILAEDLRDLGAAVARELVEAHGGSLELDGETLRVTVSASP